MTSSRQSILQKIQELRLEEKPLPVIPSQERATNLLELYKLSCTENKGSFAELDSLSLATYIENTFSDAKQICSTSQLITGNVDLKNIVSPQELALVDVAIIHADFAVAENGALWISQQSLLHPVLPFIAQHLLVILDKESIVPTMHEAYARISMTPSFGVFIAGPSKTADIEQSLVIGAHGPLSLQVILL